MAEENMKTTAESRGPRMGARRREQAPAEPKQFEEVVINVDRVARVVKGRSTHRRSAIDRQTATRNQEVGSVHLDQ